MQACWPCIRNRIHPAIDYFVFSGAHPRSVNIRGLQQNMKLAFSPHPLHASALLFMSRCERMCVNALGTRWLRIQGNECVSWRWYYMDKKTGLLGSVVVGLMNWPFFKTLPENKNVIRHACFTFKGQYFISTFFFLIDIFF